MKRLLRLFGKAPAPPPPPPAPLADPPPETTWRTGDMAECIWSGGWMNRLNQVLGSGPALGDVRMVDAVRLRDQGDRMMTYLVFRRWAPSCFEAAAFRKIVPVADRAECAETEWLKDMLGAPARPEPVQ